MLRRTPVGSVSAHGFCLRKEKGDHRAMANKTVTVGRDAKNGQFITVSEARRRTATAIVQRIKIAKH